MNKPKAVVLADLAEKAELLAAANEAAAAAPEPAIEPAIETKRPDEVAIEVVYDTVRVARFSYELSAGTLLRKPAGINRYRVVELEGFTRILSEENFDPELGAFLGAPPNSPCLYDKVDDTLQLCDDQSASVRTGYLETGDFRRRTLQTSPRGLLYGAYDSELGGMLGIANGFAVGVQARTPEQGDGTFSRWKVAGLVGVNADLAINLEKETDDEPRLVGALTPEVIFRIGRAQTFHLEQNVYVETRHESLLDLSAGYRFDTEGRLGPSFRLTVRPIASISGGTLRYTSYRDGRGYSVIFGVEMADEASFLPGAAAGSLTAAGFLLYLIFKGIEYADSNGD